MSSKIIRAGWIQRESSFLKRWKENWFVLYRSGVLMYFGDPNSSACEGKLLLREDCLYIRGGNQVNGVTPPASRNRGCLLVLKLKDDQELNLCAQSSDDMTLWCHLLNEARQRRSSVSVVPSRRHSGMTPGSPANESPGKTGSKQSQALLPNPFSRLFGSSDQQSRQTNNQRRRSVFW